MSRTQKSCFIITPIGKVDSPIRRHSEGLIDTVITPVLDELKFKTFVSHRISESGNISVQIIRHIIEDDLVIANLSGLNPNVMYELSLRHAQAGPVIIVAEEGTLLPFDIAHQRVLFFKNDMYGVVEVKKDLKRAIQETMKSSEPASNPIYDVVKDSAIRKAIKVPEGDASQYILEQLSSLNQKMSDLHQRAILSESSPSFGSFQRASMGGAGPTYLTSAGVPRVFSGAVTPTTTSSSNLPPDWWWQPSPGPSSKAEDK